MSPISADGLAMTTARIAIELWHPNAVGIGIAAALVLVYGALAGWRAQRGVGLFAAGVLLALATLVSPLDRLAEGMLFSAHMAQHLLLLLAVPPLVLLGLPHALPRLDGSPRAARLLAALGRPPLSWLLGIGIMWLWHVPALCAASLHDPLVRGVQLVTLVATGSAFAWPILSPNAAHRLQPASAIVYLVSGCLGCTALGIWITFSPISVCPGFFAGPDPLGIRAVIRGPWGLSPEADQQLAGLLMWVPACFVYLGGVLYVLARWFMAPQATASRA